MKMWLALLALPLALAAHAEKKMDKKMVKRSMASIDQMCTVEGTNLHCDMTKGKGLVDQAVAARPKPVSTNPADWFEFKSNKGKHPRRGEWSYNISLLRDSDVVRNETGMNSKAINNVNRRIALDVEQMRCTPENFTPLDMKLTDYSLAPNWVNKSFVSFTSSWNAYCGGAHPDSGQYGVFFDTKTQKKFDAPSQFADIATFIEKYALPAIKAKAKSQFNDKDECWTQFYSDDSFFDTNPVFYHFFLYPDSIGVSYSFPHVAVVCEMIAEVPYANVKAYLRAGSPLATALASKQ